MSLVVRPGRRTATSMISAGLAALLAAGTVLASTPVTVGYRDHTYGGGAFRPAADKPQSKLWYTDGSWFAGMFNNSINGEYRIYRHDGVHSWALTPTIVDTRDTSHGDYLWDETSQTLYVISSVNIPDTLPAVATDDAIKVFKYTYSASTNAYSAVVGFPKTIQNTVTVPNASKGGAVTATIALDSTGDLWATWPHDSKVKYSKSDDDGVTWSDPAQLPAQVGNSIVADSIGHLNDSAAVIAFGAGSPNKIGIAWSDQDNVPAASDNGFRFATINAGDDPTAAGNWTTAKLPTLVPTNQVADGHINIKTTSDGNVYMVGKTSTDTANCATNKNSVLTEFFDRTPAGTWGVHLLGTVGDCNTRPQLVISEQLDTAYVFLTAPNGGGTVYRKSAPLSGPGAFEFRGTADQTLQPGTPFIKSATETMIDDPSTTKQVVTSTTGIVVISDNLLGGSNVKYYLHNEMALPAADAADPVGTITLNGGAASTTSTTVSAAVPATDTGGSGVSLVRLSNSATVSGGVLTTGTTFVYNTPIAWTLPAGDGPKTVYAQWRDSAGNWSTPVSDGITVDANPATGTVKINGGAAETTTASVTLTLTTDDAKYVYISNSADFTGIAHRPYAASIPWTLTGGSGVKTVYVKFLDGSGNVSPSPVTDTITLNSPDTTPPNQPGAPKQTLGGALTGGIPLRLTWTAGSDSPGGSGVAGYEIQQSVNGAAFATLATTTGPGTTLDLMLSNTSKTYRYKVRTIDNGGNLSTAATGPTFRAISYNESSTVIAYTGSWVLSSTPTYIGGKAKYSTKAGSTATASINGNRVGFLSRTGPTSGSARIYIDGVLKKTVNLYAPTTGIRKLMFTYAWSSIGNHKMKIVVSGTAGHPRVTLDQILVLR
jgi:hypothetical protein